MENVTQSLKHYWKMLRCYNDKQLYSTEQDGCSKPCVGNESHDAH